MVRIFARDLLELNLKV